MRLRQEQVVFVLGLLVLGALGFALFRPQPIPGARRGAHHAEGGELERHAVPRVAAALPDSAATPALRRALFEPPRDTRPLPPLPLEEPPRQPLPGLLPPTVPGPAPAAFGTLLRRRLVTEHVDGLFESPGGEASEDAGTDELVPTGADDGAADGSTVAGGAARTGDEKEADPFQDESPEERAARYEGYRARYDWVTRTNGATIFGRIENHDRFQLVLGTDRASEPIEFVEVDPETGVERFRATGGYAIPIERGAIREFGFAKTIPNELALRSLQLGTEVTRGTFAERMQFAQWCVDHRLDADDALQTALDVYDSLARFDPDDPAPRLGKARALEADFQLEQALVAFQKIVEDFPLETGGQVGMAQLEARLLLYSEAEARLRRAVANDRGSWLAHRALGDFLAARGRPAEAVEHLETANHEAPGDPALLAVRVGIRDDLGDALLALGRVDDAARAYASAAQADAGDQRALAGRMVTLVLGKPDGGADEALALAADTKVEEESFELLDARALAEIVGGAAAAAETDLRRAAEVDPLRASVAWAALAFLAETTGYPDEAIDLTDRALEADPTNAYAHYLKGRLLGERDAYEEARSELLAALGIELDFEDALAALGEMAFRLGRFDDADRYLERAVAVGSGGSDGPGRPDVHALRGLDLLRLGRTQDARASFEAALATAPDDPVALGGLAWCVYLSGDATEALVKLADLDEGRRDLPETDPWRAWARAQQARITDHIAKEEWFDSFNRKRLINSWLTDERDGPTVRMKDGAVVIEGTFQRAGQTRVYREYPAGLFVSFEASVWVEPTNVRAGIFIAREKPRGGEVEVTDEASVSRHKDGTTQVRLVRSRQRPDVVDMEQPFPTGRWVRLRIEREGEGSDTRIVLSLDGVPLIEGARMPSIGSGSSPLLVGLFVEGEVGREADVRMDDVSVVYRVR